MAFYLVIDKILAYSSQRQGGIQLRLKSSFLEHGRQNTEKQLDTIREAVPVSP